MPGVPGKVDWVEDGKVEEVEGLMEDQVGMRSPLPLPEHLIPLTTLAPV